MRVNKTGVSELSAGALKRNQIKASLWHVPLRVVIGFGFAAHGYAKLSRGPGNFGTILQALGVPIPNLVAWITSIIELAGEFSLMIGVFVVPVSIRFCLIMLTAIFKVHLQFLSSVRLRAITPSGGEFGPIGYEINFLYIVGLITLDMAGPTKTLE